MDQVKQRKLSVGMGNFMDRHFGIPQTATPTEDTREKVKRRDLTHTARVTIENDVGDDEGSYCSSSDEERTGKDRNTPVIDNEMKYDEKLEETENIDGDKSVMQIYLRTIQSRLKVECNTSSDADEKNRSDNNQFSLLEFLERNEFWIRRESAKYICTKLNIRMSLEGYYRDVLIWYPDIHYKVTPPCPYCTCNGRVGVHGYNDKTVARRVIGMKMHYYVMTRRYICHACENIKPRTNYTFRGYHDGTLKLLPKQLNLAFPAIITQKVSLLSYIIIF